MKSKNLKIKIICALLVASLATILIIQHQSQAKLRDENKSLRAQVDQLAQLTPENERLSKLVAQGNNSLAKDQLSELLKLRGEVGVLRRHNQQLVKMRVENERHREVAIVPNASTQSLKGTNEDSDDIIYLMKQLTTTFQFTHSVVNPGQYPTNFAQMKESLPSNLPLEQLFEFVPTSKPIDDKNSRRMVFREKIPRQRPDGKWERVYGLVDGTAQRATSDDGSFEAFEDQVRRSGK
ncbi:MAG: hypothetical protein ACR2H1_10030 [Limisphaerales bacterium]